MTDPGTADRTYIGPMTPELVEQILEKVSLFCSALGPLRYVIFCRKCTPGAVEQQLTALHGLQERPEAILPTMGGQTALNLAKALSEVRCSISIHCPRHSTCMCPLSARAITPHSGTALACVPCVPCLPEASPWR